MVYYGYRWYVPELQRWPNSDPFDELGFETVRSEMSLQIPPLLVFEEMGSANLHVFAHGDPIGRIDIDGRVLFQLCNRQIENPENDLIIGAANVRGHDFYRWKNGTGGYDSVGYRNPHGKDGSKPEVDCPELARTCRNCFKNGGKLKYGSGNNKRSHKATDEEVQECLKNRPIKGDYHGIRNNSNDWAKGAGKDCGLSCSPISYVVK